MHSEKTHPSRSNLHSWNSGEDRESVLSVELGKVEREPLAVQRSACRNRNSGGTCWFRRDQGLTGPPTRLRTLRTWRHIRQSHRSSISWMKSSGSIIQTSWRKPGLIHSGTKGEIFAAPHAGTLIGAQREEVLRRCWGGLLLGASSYSSLFFVGVFVSLELKIVSCLSLPMSRQVSWNSQGLRTEQSPLCPLCRLCPLASSADLLQIFVHSWSSRTRPLLDKHRRDLLKRSWTGCWRPPYLWTSPLNQHTPPGSPDGSSCWARSRSGDQIKLMSACVHLHVSTSCFISSSHVSALLFCHMINLCSFNLCCIVFTLTGTKRSSFDSSVCPEYK